MCLTLSYPARYSWKGEIKSFPTVYDRDVIYRWKAETLIYPASYLSKGLDSLYLADAKLKWYTGHGYSACNHMN